LQGSFSAGPDGLSRSRSAFPGFGHPFFFKSKFRFFVPLKMDFLEKLDFCPKTAPYKARFFWQFGLGGEAR